MSQNARSDQGPAPRTMPIADLQCIAEAWLKSRRRLGASSDVPSGTAARITARSSAGMRRVTTDLTNVCSTCVALSALLQDRRLQQRSSAAAEDGYSRLRPGRSVSVGAGVAGSLEGTADGIAHSARGWSAPAAAGWVTKSIAATCATGGGGTQSPAGTSARSGPGALNATPATRISSARRAAMMYVARAALAAKDAISKSATNAV